MKTLGRVILAGALGGAMLIAGSASACTLIPYKASNYRIDTRAMPAMMLASAATVDVAVAESVDRSISLVALDEEEAAQLANATSDDERAAIRADLSILRNDWRQSGAGAVTYRVVERLKGASADTFVLNGFVPVEIDPEFPEELRKSIAARGAYLEPRATWAMRIRELTEWGGPGSCAEPVTAVLGVSYLIFRDAEGHLMKDGVSEMDRINGRFQPSTRDGPVYEPVLLEGDPWLEAVRAAAANR